ncbi:hypothetical protein L1987_08046 [Smallanthus sonchifolius]|uniref:Uncharacterized protein n=1 Tax=Smallanthus sonchifolius TaxID=185202 RepID=A0ACB9JKN2_9ASTR|nr:hypothetical protein L1987_08046 [Smallanthus sonchifolius]
MEFILSFPTIVTTTFSIFVFLFYIINKKSAKNRKPPEAQGAWPLIGHLHLLGGSELPHKVLGDLADKYGPIFTMKLGFHRALIVNNAELARECLTKCDKAFASRPKAQAFELMAYNCAVFGFSQYGDYWRQARKLAMCQVLSQRNVEMLEHLRVSELRVSIKNIYDVWLENKKDMVKVEMSSWFDELVLNIMVKIVSGNWFSSNDHEGDRFRVVIKNFFELLGVFEVSDFIPYLKFLDVSGYKKRMKKTGKQLDQIFEGWLKEHKMKGESDMKNLVYLEAIIKETLRLHPGVPLSVPHESIEDCVVDGYNIPKGTRLCHQDIDVKGKHFDLIPFGSGRRMCPGATLALHQLRLTLASLIQQFELKPPSMEPIDMSGRFGIVVSKKIPLEVLPPPPPPRLSPGLYGVGE